MIYFRVNFDFTFDDEMARRSGCEVFSFDPTMGVEDHEHGPHVHFYNLGLASYDRERNPDGSGHKMRTLDTLIKELNHTQVGL